MHAALANLTRMFLGIHGDGLQSSPLDTKIHGSSSPLKNTMQFDIYGKLIDKMAGYNYKFWFLNPNVMQHSL